MSVATIVNHIAVDQNTVLAGQPSPEQLAAARDEGFEVVINLLPADAPGGADFDEASAARDLGLRYHHIPVPWSAPTEEQYWTFAATMDEAAGRRTLVHCAINCRVTAFYSTYAMERLGWSAAQVDALMAPLWTAQSKVAMGEAWRRLIE